jgi:ribosomal protein S18 acetylase RimI-like enzyme
MIAIRPLLQFDPDRFQIIAGGYTTAERYRVDWSESDAQTHFSLTLEPLAAPERYDFPYMDDDIARYTALIPGDFCLGAFDGDLLIGVALGEKHEWNNTLWVWEFHVAPAYQGQGIGRRLMAEVAARARAAGIRALVAETQNSNVKAIRFYRRVGFTLEGIDISYYTNEDLRPDRTVALFMKLRLT